MKTITLAADIERLDLDQLIDLIANALCPVETDDAEGLGYQFIRIDVDKEVNQAALDGLLPLRHPKTWAPIDYSKHAVMLVEDLGPYLASRGLSLVIDTAPAKDTETPAPVATACDGPTTIPAVPHWKMLVQAEATAFCLRLRKAGANPTKHSILEAMAKWCRENDVLTDGNIYPSEGYLRTHVLGGKHWDVPN